MDQAPPGIAGLPPRPPSPRSSQLKIFVGPCGIRAGWRLLLFLSIATVLTLILYTLISSTAHLRTAAGLTPSVAILSEGASSLALLLSAALMARLERRSLRDYGIPARNAFGRQFWEGALWGFAAITMLLVFAAAAHAFSFGHLAVRGSSLLYYGCAWGLGFLAVAFSEEFLFRGYALYTLSTSIGFWPAALLLSTAFGAVHKTNSGETSLGVVSAGLIGLFFCFTVRRTGNLWFAAGMHFMWDYSESFVYSVPDSGVVVTGHLLDSSVHGPRWLCGGPAGPEGSALAFVLLAALFVVFDRRYRDKRFPAPRSL